MLEKANDEEESDNNLSTSLKAKKALEFKLTQAYSGRALREKSMRARSKFKKTKDEKHCIQK